MILERIKLKDGLNLEIVDGEDITHSYRNNKLVSSCMSAKRRWRYTKLYNYIKDLKLIRILKKKDLVLRALLWTVTSDDQTLKFIDRVYYKSYPKPCNDYWCDGCSKCTPQIAHPFAYERFKEIWPKLADMRNSNRELTASLNPNKVKIWPYMDTFEYYSKERLLLSNRYSEDFEHYEDVTNHAIQHVPI